MAARKDNEELLEEASSVMSGVLRRMREQLQSWEIENAAFGVEDPAVIEARRREEEKPEPVEDRPPPRGLLPWRELFRKNWPDNAPVKRRRRWWI